MADPAPGQGVDWLMQSLCSAHLEEAEQWGTGIGLVDSLFLTNEEWTDFVDGADYTGIPAHAIDLATKTAYAVGVFTLGGFEKIVEFNCGHADYVCFSPSGYNGNFGVDGADTTNIKSGTTPDGNAYVYPKDVVPTRIYIGLKGRAADGTADTTGYLARNGLAYGQLYGFATDITTTTGGLFRDDWSKVTTRTCGDTVSGYFAPIDWMWDGTVKQFKEDGSWAFQHLTADGDPFWNSGGRQVAGKKTEHNSPDPYGGFRYIQTSTAGHFGVIDYTGVTALLDAVAGTTSFPTKIPADYINIEGEVDISARIELNGKGKYANGGDATQNYDSDQAVGAGKVTFEDIDGFEWVSAGGTSDGYVIIQEDSGNDYGERTFIAELTIGTPLTYYLIALSGGDKSTRTSNGVGVPATASGSPNTHEFSGVIDLSGMLAKDSTGAYVATAGDGKSRLDANKDVWINDKYIAMGLQAHDHWGGVIAAYKGDRGGAIYVYQPDLPNQPSPAPTPAPTSPPVDYGVCDSASTWYNRTMFAATSVVTPITDAQRVTCASDQLSTIGSITAMIAEATDCAYSSTVTNCAADGASGDVSFPWGNLKVRTREVFCELSRARGAPASAHAHLVFVRARATPPRAADLHSWRVRLDDGLHAHRRARRHGRVPARRLDDPRHLPVGELRPDVLGDVPVRGGLDGRDLHGLARALHRLRPRPHGRLHEPLGLGRIDGQGLGRAHPGGVQPPRQQGGRAQHRRLGHDGLHRRALLEHGPLGLRALGGHHGRPGAGPGRRLAHAVALLGAP